VVLVTLFPDTVLSVLTSDPGAVESARRTVQVAALALIVVVPAELWLGALNGTGDSGAALALELVWSFVMLGAAAATALHFDLRLEYIWLSLPASAVVALAGSYARLRGGRWRRRTV
jgi:Na+-driven multidrug efflux pump